MKVILQFNIPEDQEEYEVCFYGYKWKSIVEDLDNGPPLFYLSPLVMTVWIARLIFLGLSILGKFIKRKYEGFNKWFDSKFENKKHA